MIFHRLILLLLAGLIGCVCSAPVPAHLPNNVDSRLEFFTPRAKLNSATVRKHFKQEGVKIVKKINKSFKPGPSQSVLWSGKSPKADGRLVSVYHKAQAFAKQHGMKTINHALRDAKITIPTKKQNSYSAHIWKFASKAWAKAAHGEVTAVVGSEVDDKSVYKTIEKPTLMANKAVTKVVEWNTHTGKKTQIKPPK
ncbi:hypothetical protein D9619_009902 [Psilocybe cf. subviscida]|uniref:Uncharacterized protein n=1 Tax=Psilocybe cf. subviscida TaxID=2480587 RepID=A0A8H5BN45_9AGAR|nr:hypothetical protein D9619_009902 [Psilocybe cf. subviscida]